VLVDAVSARTGGGGTHAVSQLAALARVPGIELTVYATGEIAQRLAAAGVGPVRRVPQRSVLRRIAWEQLVLPARARSHDVVYAIGNVTVFLSPRPVVVAQQNAWYFGDYVRAFRRARCRLAMRVRLVAEAALARASIRHAARAVAVSRTLHAAIEEDLGHRANLRVVLSATPRSSASTVLATDGGGRSDAPYALVVANDYPNKELDLLAAVFARRPDLPRLKIVGHSSPPRRAAIKRAGGPRVDVVGVVTDPAALHALYAGAVCCVAHSHFESFGLTPLEALAAGTPVVAADIPAHREVCGDRISYYAPDDLDALAALVFAPGAAPAAPPAEWTWDDNARELAAVLREARDDRLTD
jgi:glycosyltransferase involved in cell wall biosynthesis